MGKLLDRIGKGNTKIRLENGAIVVKYHTTDIVTIFPSNSVLLNTNTWRTSTTKTRINRVLDIFKTGWFIYQKDGIWYAAKDGYTVEYFDFIHLKPVIKGQVFLNLFRAMLRRK